MKIHTRIVSLIVLFSVAILAFAGCGASKPAETPAQSQEQPAADKKTDAGSETPAKSADKPETVTIGHFSGNDDNLLVKEKGWLEEEFAKDGIKVKWVNFQSGREMNSAMLAKSIDFAGGIGDPPVTIAASSGIPYQIYWISNIIAESEALAVRNGANINSIKELKGKKIATTVTSTSHYSLLSALDLNGLTASDVQIIDLNPQDIVAAWQRGDIDAAYTWDPNLSKLYADGKKLISSKDLADAGAPTSAYNIVRTDFAEKYPQIVDAYIKALIKAQDLYKNTPDSATEVWAKALSIDKAESLKQAQGNNWLTPEEQLSSKFLGTSAQKGDTVKSLKKIGDFLVDQKSLPGKLEASAYEKFVNPAYLEKALKK